MYGKWILGVILAIFGSAGSNFGQNIQKYSLTYYNRRRKDKVSPYYKQPLWLVGLLFMVVCSLCDLIALSMAAQSIIAPLGSVTLITNLLFGHLWLKEDLGKKELGGTLAILLGSILTVSFGNHYEPSYNLAHILKLWKNADFIFFLILLLLIEFSLYWLSRHLKSLRIIALAYSSDLELGQHESHNINSINNDHHNQDNNTISEENSETKIDIQKNNYSVNEEYLDQDLDQKENSNFNESEMNLKNENIKTSEEEEESIEVKHKKAKLRYEQLQKYHPFVLCGLSGILSGQSFLLGKMVAVLIAESVGGIENQISNGFFFLFCILMLLSIGLQIHFFTKAMELFDTLLVVPLFQGSLILTSTFAAASFFQEFHSFDAVQIFFFMLGLLFILFGVIIFGSRRIENPHAANSLHVPLFEHQEENQEEDSANVQSSNTIALTKLHSSSSSIINQQ